jgi:hypothetical protein
MGDLSRLSAHAQVKTGVQAACLYQAPSRGRRRGCGTRRARGRRNAAQLVQAIIVHALPGTGELAIEITASLSELTLPGPLLKRSSGG